jgi:hypothetical protein
VPAPGINPQIAPGSQSKVEELLRFFDQAITGRLPEAERAFAKERFPHILALAESLSRNTETRP